MKRWDIINLYVQKNGYKDYLEIGLDSGICRDSVIIENKTTVDPDVRTMNPTHLMTSDDFFAQNKNTFDVIFIDGLHHADQVLKDIENSLKVLNKGGMIFCHDMMPTTEKIQAVPRISDVWTGDCWKAFVRLKGTRKDLDMFIVSDDWGVGVIQKGKQKLVPEFNIDIEKMDWAFYCQHREKLNYISVDELKELVNKA